MELLVLLGMGLILKCKMLMLYKNVKVKNVTNVKGSYNTKARVMMLK